MGGESSGADEMVKFAFVVVGASGFLFDVGRADCFVRLLSAGGFGFEVADVEVLFAVGFFDVICHRSERLAREV